MKTTRNIATKASDSTISPQLVSRIEAKLKERFDVLQAMKAQANKEAAAEIEETRPDEVDAASALESAESSRMMAETLRLELIKISDALDRIRAGSFGTCEDCDSQIPAKRLEIRPEARLCVDCQAEEERHFGRAALGRGGDLAFAS
jgi:DnaK suppressor protein